MLHFSSSTRAGVLAAMLMLPAIDAHAQTSGSVGIGTTAPNAKAALDIAASDKGLLIPRLDSVQRVAITSPPQGLLVYQRDGRAGLWYYQAGWQLLKPGGPDNLGNHTATQPLNLNGQKLTGGGASGVSMSAAGAVKVDVLAGTGPGRLVTVADDGTLQAQGPLFNSPLSMPPAVPAQVGTLNVGGTPFAVAVNPGGTRAYVVHNNMNMLQVLDISNSTAPTLLSTTHVGGSPISVAINPAGTRIYVVSYQGAELRVYDVSLSNTPVLVGSPVSTRAGGSANPVYVAVNPAGTRAYVLNVSGISSENTLQAYDISNPGAAPVPVGSGVPMPDWPSSVAINQAGTRAYVVSSFARTIQALDISNSNVAPVAIGSPVATGVRPEGVAVNPAGTRAYVVNRTSNTLQAYDISNPNAAPIAIGSPVATGAEPHSVVIHPSGSRAYVVNRASNTLQAYDLSNPNTPPVAAGPAIATGSSPTSMAVNPAGTYAYVTNSIAGTVQAFAVGIQPRIVAQGVDGTLGTLDVGSLGDHLGNHTATQNLNLGTHQLVGNGGTNGLHIASSGAVTVPALGGGGNRMLTTDNNGLLGATTLPTDAQQLSKSGSLISLTNGGSVIDADNQGLSLSGATLAISGGTAITLPDADATNELQTISKSGSTVTLSNGGGSFTDADAQQLSISSSTISLTNGGSVTVPSSADNLGSHSATQDINLNSTYDLLLRDANHGLGWYGVSKPWNGLNIDGPALYGYSGGVLGTNQGGARTTALGWNASGNVGIGSTSPAARLHVVGGGAGNIDFIVNGRMRLGDSNNNGGVWLNSATTQFLGQYDATRIGFYNGGAWRIMIDAAGNMGIGTANPTQKLEVVGGVKITGTGNGLTFPDNSVQTTAAVDNQTLSLSGQTLTISKVTGAGSSVTLPSGADNLGSHTATQTLQMGANVVQFANSVAQKIQLYGTEYALGVQDFTHYTRSGDGFAWYVGGSHHNAQYNPGGGITQMVLRNRKLGIGATDEPIAPLEVRRDDADAYLAMHDPGNAWFSFGMHYADNNKIKLGDGPNLNGTNYLTILRGSGNMGLGTTNPAARLDVQGSGSIGTYNFAYYAYNGSVAVTGAANNSASDVSIRASGRIVASEFNATSDARLKHIVGLTDNATDLKLLQRLRITDYTMRDRAQYGTRPFKKVIAQEVEAVFPQAVSQHAGFLPDVYAPASSVEAAGDSLLRLTLPKALPAAQVGQRVKLIARQGEVVATVTAASGSTLLVSGARQLAADREIFVYGLEHPDVRTVDYEALSMLNVSATQELARQLEALRQQYAAQQAVLRTLEAKVANQEADHAALLTLQAQLARLMGEAVPSPGPQARK